jgi:hypothetical protein
MTFIDISLPICITLQCYQIDDAPNVSSPVDAGDNAIHDSSSNDQRLPSNVEGESQASAGNEAADGAESSTDTDDESSADVNVPPNQVYPAKERVGIEGMGSLPLDEDLVRQFVKQSEARLAGSRPPPVSDDDVVRASFPHKLHAILAVVALLPRFARIVRWLPDGKSFMIINRALFVAHILRPYFHYTKCTEYTAWRNYTRQLGRYGFGTMKGDSHGSLICFHPFFAKDSASLLDAMATGADHVAAVCVANEKKRKRTFSVGNNGDEQLIGAMIAMLTRLVDCCKEAGRASTRNRNEKMRIQVAFQRAAEEHCGMHNGNGNPTNTEPNLRRFLPNVLAKIANQRFDLLRQASVMRHPELEKLGLAAGQTDEVKIVEVLTRHYLEIARESRAERRETNSAAVEVYDPPGGQGEHNVEALEGDPPEPCDNHCANLEAERREPNSAAVDDHDPPGGQGEHNVEALEGDPPEPHANLVANSEESIVAYGMHMASFLGEAENPEDLLGENLSDSDLSLFSDLDFDEHEA